MNIETSEEKVLQAVKSVIGERKSKHLYVDENPEKDAVVLMHGDNGIYKVIEIDVRGIRGAAKDTGSIVEAGKNIIGFFYLDFDEIEKKTAEYLAMLED